MEEKLPKRKRVRLENFDYSTEGAYFITICTKDRRMILSQIVGAIHESPAVELTKIGFVVENTIEKMSSRFGIEIDQYIIMPNHIHLIIVIEDLDRAIRESPLHKRSVISKAIGYMKMNVSKQIRETNPNISLWQRSFYDHVIRDREDFLNHQKYILESPLHWLEDELYFE